MNETTNVGGTAAAPALAKPVTGLELLDATTAKPKATLRAESAATDDVISFVVDKGEFLSALTLSESGKTTGVTIAITGEFEYLGKDGNVRTVSVLCQGARVTVKKINS